MIYLKQGLEQVLALQDDQSQDKITEYVHKAIEENMHLSQYSLEKGFICQNWCNAQNKWKHTQAGKTTKKYQTWGKDLVVALQTYTYEVWKARNEMLHGSNKSKNMEKKKERCRNRIKELYSLPRQGLTLEDKKCLDYHSTID